MGAFNSSLGNPAGAAAGSGSGPAGSGAGSGVSGDIVLTLTVDPTSGQVVLKNLASSLQQLTQQSQSASGQTNQHAQQAAAGWLALAGQVAIVTRAIDGYIAAVKSTIIESTLLAARIEVLNTTLNLTASNMNYSAASVNANVEGIRKLNITHQEAIQTTLAFMRAQLKLTDSLKLTRAAQDLAVVSGQNSSEALGTMIEAIQTQREVLLRSFGIIATLPQIYERYAASVNRSVASLTTLEKEQAVLNIILVQGQKVSGAYLMAMDDAGKMMTSLPRLWATLQEQIGSGFVPIMKLAIIELSSLLSWLAKIPAPVYTAVGAFLLTLGAFTSLIAITKTFTATLALLGVTGATVGAQFSSLWAVLATNPITAVVAGLAGLAALITLITSATEGENKAAVENIRNKAGELKQVQDLDDEYKKYVVLKQRVAALNSGSALTKNELGSTASMEMSVAKRVALENMSTQAANKYKDILASAKALHVDIADVVGKEVDGSDKLEINYEKLWRVQRDREDAQVKSIGDVEKLIKNTEELVKSNEKYRDGLQKNSIALGDLWKFLRSGDVFTSDEEAILRTSKSIEELIARLRNLKETRDQIKNSATGTQFVLIDTNTAAQGIQKVLSAYERLDQMRRSSVTSTAYERQQVEQLRSAIGSTYDSLVKNYKNMSETRKDLSDQDRATLKEDQAHAEAMSKAVQVQTSFLTKQGPAWKSIQAGVEQASKDLEHFGAMNTKFNNGAQLTEEALNSLMSSRMNAQGQVVKLQIESNNLTIAQRQEESQALTLGSYKLADLRKQLDIQNDIGRIGVENAKLQDVSTARIAAQNEKTKEKAALAELSNRLYQTEMSLQIDAINTQQRYLAISKGVTAEDRIQAALEIQKFEINKIFNTRGISDEEKASQILSKRVETQAAINAAVEAGVQLSEQAAQEELTREQEKHAALTRTQEDEINGIEAVEAMLRRKEALDEAHIVNDQDMRRRMNAEGLSDQEKDARMQSLIDSVHIKANREIYDQELRIKELRFSAETAVLDLANKAAVATGRATQTDVDLKMKQRDLIKQMSDMMREQPAMAGKILSAEEKISEQMTRQANEQKAIDLANKGQTEINAGNASGNMSLVIAGYHDMVQGANDAEDALNKLNAAIKANGGATAEQAAQVGNLASKMLTLPQLFMAIGAGELKNISITQAYRATMDAFGTAVTSAVTAMEQGGNGAAALENAIAAMMVQISGLAVKQTLLCTAYGIAASAGLPGFGDAAQDFAAAAVFAVIAATTGIAGAAMGGGNQGTSGSNNTGLAQQNSFHAPQTMTATENNQVQLAQAIQYQGKTLMQIGQNWNTASAAMIKFLENPPTDNQKKNDQALTTIMSDQLADITTKFADEGVTQSNQVALLKRIASATETTADKDTSVVLSPTISLDAGTLNGAIDNRIANAPVRLQNNLAAQVNKAVLSNSNRRTIARNLRDGGTS